VATTRCRRSSGSCSRARSRWARSSSRSASLQEAAGS
jgi:hypothetical protein